MKVAIVIASYNRMNDLEKVLKFTTIPKNYKYIICANYSAEEYKYLTNKYSIVADIIDEREIWGKLGVIKAANLCYEKVCKMGFDYMIWLNDDSVIVDKNWYEILEKSVYSVNADLAVFASNDEKHGEYGWSILGLPPYQVPEAYFFALKCGSVNYVFNEKFRFYSADDELPCRVYENKGKIILCPIRVMHWFAENEKRFEKDADRQILKKLFPKVTFFLDDGSWTNSFVKFQNNTILVEENFLDKLNYSELSFNWSEFLKDKKVYIFGAGEEGGKILKWLNLYNINSCGFIDNNRAYWHQKYLEKVIYSPQIIKSEKDMFIIIASDWYLEIKKQLIGYGLLETKQFLQIPVGRLLNDFWKIQSSGGVV